MSGKPCIRLWTPWVTWLTTRTRKVRRGFIAERYSNLVDALYSNKQSVAVQSEVRYEDGRTGTVSAELSLCDAVTYPPSNLRKAA